MPPLEQADILSLDRLQSADQPAGRGRADLARRSGRRRWRRAPSLNQLAQSIGGALNLDTFEIALAPEAGTDAQVTVGQQLGQNLYVKVQQGVGEQSPTNFILEYELTKWLRLQTNVVQGSATQQSMFRRAQGSGADLIFFFSF